MNLPVITMFAIDVQNLTKNFRDVVAVDNLTLQVKEGEIYGLVGPDGAGKTTTLRLLSGVLKPDKGEGTVTGFRLFHDREKIKENISYMPQRFALYTDLTVEENIRFYADVFEVPGKLWRERAERWLKMSNLFDFKNRLVQNLSGGMKQKVALICALIHTPKMLLLDEPTNGVDPVSRRDFWGILYGLLKERVTILVSTAYLDEAERCNRIGLLHHGRMLLEGDPAAVKNRFPGQVAEIVCGERERVKSLLRDLEGVQDVIVSGDRIHVHLDDFKRRESAVRERLKGADIQAECFAPVSPSLEDVFMSLVQREQKKGETG
ncbi:MAG: ABC transporter ATP-binding protein [Desulfovibrionales bacterium]|nr:ABC transporter ATP-binding protein [Desulfovibrionales bacterium]